MQVLRTEASREIGEKAIAEAITLGSSRVTAMTVTVTTAAKAICIRPKILAYEGQPMQDAIAPERHQAATSRCGL